MIKDDKITAEDIKKAIGTGEVFIGIRLDDLEDIVANNNKTENKGDE